jgi:hypothetical protein
MKHSHERRICKLYFECSCDGSGRPPIYRQDFPRMLWKTLLADSVLKGLLWVPVSTTDDVRL